MQFEDLAVDSLKIPGAQASSDSLHKALGHMNMVSSTTAKKQWSASLGRPDDMICFYHWKKQILEELNNFCKDSWLVT